MPKDKYENRLPDGKSLVIIGLMGAGKSCIGRRVAKNMGVPFVDADAEIEEAAGCSVSDIFDLYGEKEFREGERRVIKRILSGESCILATGGGAFMNEQTRKIISEKGVSLWLKADVDVLIKRTSGRSHRPLLNKGEPDKVLKKLVKERYPLYEKADIVVETHDESLDKTVKRVLTSIRKSEIK